MTSERDDVRALSAEELRILDGWRPFVPNLGVLLAEHATLRAKLTEAMRFHANEHADRLRAEAERDAATARAAEAERLLRGIVEADDREIALMAQPVREGRESDMNRAACARMHAIDAARQSLKAKEPTDDR